MRIVRWAAGIGIVAAVAIPAVAWPRSRGEERAAKIAQALAGKTFSLVEAIRTAEAHTGGIAIESEVEVEDGKATVEVVILKGGALPALLEVEVDGATNKILESEDDEGGEDHEGADDDENDEGEQDDDG